MPATVNVFSFPEADIQRLRGGQLEAAALGRVISAYAACGSLSEEATQGMTVLQRTINGG